MAFSTTCIHKGCRKDMEPYLDKTTNLVYCSECERELTHLTHFAKVQLKSLNQVRKRPPQAYSVTCQSCNKVNMPIVEKKVLVCPSCLVPHTHLSQTFTTLVLNKLHEAK